MKIAHVITTIDRGGAEKQLLTVCREQKKLGHSITIFPLKGNLELVTEFNRIKVDVDLVFFQKNFIKQLLYFKRKLKEDFDIYHAHLPQAEILTTFGIQKNHLLVITRHFAGKFAPKLPKFLSSFLSRIATYKASKVIAISNSVREVLILNKEVLHPEKIEVVYYGYDRKYKNSKVRVRKNKKNLSIGTIARLSPEKDLTTLISAISNLKNENYFCSLKIVGDGPLKSQLFKIVHSSNLENNIEFLGKIADPYPFLKSLDVFVLASKFEGFGLSLLEAMDSGTKIVVSKNSALEEIVGDSFAAIYFKTSDALDLSQKIKYANRISIKKFNKDQKTILEKFTSKKMIYAIEKIYVNLVN